MNTVGKNITFSIFGESHGNAIGGVIGGFLPGFLIDFEKIDNMLSRRNHRAVYSTPRSESDSYEILSGVFNGRTTGAPISFIMRNKDTKSSHYDTLKTVMRPGHSDYSAYVKYNGFNDYRGGGHFSGRITAPLTFAGALAMDVLSQKNVNIFSHIISIGNVKGESLVSKEIKESYYQNLSTSVFPVLNDDLKEKFLKEIEKASSEGDSLGGVLEVVVTGIKSGVGDPFFDSVESQISKMMFSIPAVKAIEFGVGFDIAKMKGSMSNDSYIIEKCEVKTTTNNNGGIVGGITNGMPIIFRIAIKPTSSIFKKQQTIDVEKMENTTLELVGRHDLCIVPRAAAVAEAAAALVLLDMIGGK